MELERLFMEYSNIQIAGMIGLVLIFLFVFFEAIWLVFKYMRNHDKEK